LTSHFTGMAAVWLSQPVSVHCRVFCLPELFWKIVACKAAIETPLLAYKPLLGTSKN